MQENATPSNFETTLSKYNLANVSLIIPIMVANGLTQFVTGQDSLASVATKAINQTSGTFLLSSVALFGLMGVAKALKYGWVETKKQEARLQENAAVQLNTNVQEAIKALNSQTNNDPAKTLEVANFRLSVAILDGDDNKKSIYTEVKKRLTTPSQNLDNNSDFAMG